MASGSPPFHAWECACGARNGPARGTCHRCGRSVTHARIQFYDSRGEVRALARQQSYTKASWAILFLYLTGYLPGLLANWSCLREAERMETLAGLSLPGVGRLRWLWLTVRPVLAIGYLVLILVSVLSFWGFRISRPALPTAQTPPAPQRPAPIQQPPSPQFVRRPTYLAPVRLPTLNLREIYSRTGPPVPAMGVPRRTEVEEPAAPEKPLMVSPVWLGGSSETNASGSLDPPLPETAPPIQERSHAPIALHGGPITVTPRRFPDPIRPARSSQIIWQPRAMRAPSFR
jgi:hypothetical protein